MNINEIAGNRYQSEYSSTDRYVGNSIQSTTASRTAIDQKKGTVKDGSVAAVDLNLPGSLEEEKSHLQELLEQRMSVENQLDQMGADIAIDDEILMYEAAKQSHLDEASENYSQVERLTEQKEALAETFQISPDSKEAQETALLEKLKTGETLTDDEMAQIEAMDGLTEYQSVVLDYVDQIEIWKKRGVECQNAVKAESRAIQDIQLERLKSEPMLELKKDVQEVLDGINEEIQTAITQEGLTEEDKKGLVVDQQI